MKILIETEITAKREDGETPQQEALQGGGTDHSLSRDHADLVMDIRSVTTQHLLI